MKMPLGMYTLTIDETSLRRLGDQIVFDFVIDIQDNGLPSIETKKPPSRKKDHKRRCIDKCEWVADYVASSDSFIDIEIGEYEEHIPLAHKLRIAKSGNNREGFIYIITDGDAVKIGQTTNPKGRFSAIQTSNPREITVLQTIKVADMDSAEQSIHYHYRSYHIRDEWFDLLPVFGIGEGVPE